MMKCFNDLSLLLNVYKHDKSKIFSLINVEDCSDSE